MAKAVQLEPCICGTSVELMYYEGVIGHPQYYIHCDKCDREMRIPILGILVRNRDKCKRELIERWNNTQSPKNSASS